MVKGKVAPPKCLLHVATQISKTKNNIETLSKILSIIGQKKEFPERKIVKIKAK